MDMAKSGSRVCTGPIHMNPDKQHDEHAAPKQLQLAGYFLMDDLSL